MNDELRPIIEALWSVDDRIRLWAVRELSGLGPRAAETVPDLVQKLEDDSELVALGAKSALREIGVAGIPYLLQFMDNPQEREKFRWYAAEALADIGPQSLPHLLQAMKNQDNTVRMMAVESLPRVGIVAEQTVPRLKEFLREDSTLSHSSIISLAQIAKLQLETSSTDSTALDVLLHSLKTGDPILRRRIVEALEFLGDKIFLAESALREATMDQDEEVRIKALRVLKR